MKEIKQLICKNAFKSDMLYSNYRFYSFPPSYIDCSYSVLTFHGLFNRVDMLIIYISPEK